MSGKMLEALDGPEDRELDHLKDLLRPLDQLTGLNATEFGRNIKEKLTALGRGGHPYRLDLYKVPSGVLIPDDLYVELQRTLARMAERKQLERTRALAQLAEQFEDLRARMQTPEGRAAVGAGVLGNADALARHYRPGKTERHKDPLPA